MNAASEAAVFPAALMARAEAIIHRAIAADLKIATVESCTGGLVAGLLTAIAGSSAVFERGFVTYSNEAKTDLVGVPADLIAAHGAVSELVARAMAQGGIAHSQATLAVAITGIAGPGGGSVEKPVGLVHFGCSRRHGETMSLVRRYGDLGRSGIRLAAVSDALALIEAHLL